MPRSRRLRKNKRTKRMRGGNEDELARLTTAETIADASTVTEPVVNSAEPVANSAEPVVNSVEPVAEPETKYTPPTLITKPDGLAEKAKHATRKAVNWLKGWFGIGDQTQSGGKRRRKTRKTRKMRKH